MFYEYEYKYEYEYDYEEEAPSPTARRRNRVGTQRVAGGSDDGGSDAREYSSHVPTSPRPRPTQPPASTQPTPPTPPVPPIPPIDDYDDPPPMATLGALTDVRAVIGTNNISIEVTTDGIAYLDVTIVSDTSETGRDWTTGNQLASGRTRVNDIVEGEFISVFLSSTLPRNFIVTATLTDDNGRELTDEAVFIDYTQVFEAFAAATIYDFDQDRVVNLDNSIDENFMVVTDEVTIIEMDGRNDSFSIVNENTFVFQNADSDIASLAVGDRIVVIADDGIIHLIEIREITQSGSNVTIVANEEYTIIDFFDHITVNVREYLDNPDVSRSFMSLDATMFSDFAPAGLRRNYPFSRNFNRVMSGSAGNFKVDAWIGLDVYIIAEIQYSVTWGFLLPNLSIIARLGVGYAAEIDATARATSAPASGSATSISVFSGSVPIGWGFNTSLSIDLIVDWHAQAEGNVNIFAAAQAGIIYNNGSIQTFTWREGPNLEPRFEGSLHFSIGPRISASIDWLRLVTATVWIHPRVEIGAYAHFNIDRPMTGNYHHDCNGCLGGHVDFVVDAGFRATYRILGIRGTIVNRTFPNMIRTRLFSFHFSFDNRPDSVHRGRAVFGIGTCPNVIPRIWFDPQDAQGRTVNTASVAVNRFSGNELIDEGTGRFSTFLRRGNFTATATYRNITFPRNFTVTDRSGTVVIPTLFVPVTNVSLNRNEITLTRNGRGSLVATVTPHNASNSIISWSSSNENVATVDDAGVVTAVGAGTANIIVTTADGGRTASSTVTVTIPLSHVSLPGRLTMSVGATEALAPVINPVDASNQAVTWLSSNPSVATVSNGNISAVSSGEAIIRVTTADGGRMAQTIVTVINPVTGITFNEPYITLEEGNTTTVSPIISPANATNNSVGWRSSNPSVVRVYNNGTVHALRPGTATIRVTTTDSSVSGSFIVTVPGNGDNGTDLRLIDISIPSPSPNEALTPMPSEQGITLDVSIDGLEPGDYVQLSLRPNNYGLSLADDTTIGIAGGTLTLVYDGLTEVDSYDTISVAVALYQQVSGDETYSANEYFSANVVNISVRVIDGQADGARSIPINQGNIDEFNIFANTAVGSTRNYRLTGTITLLDPPAGGSNWVPIGSATSPFVGTFDGSHFPISNLVVNRPTESNQGLFGVIGNGGIVKNVALYGVSVIANSTIGSIAGINNGMVKYSYSIISASGVSGGSFVGGLVGRNEGTLQNSFSDGAVSGGGTFVGGLVGQNGGIVQDAYSVSSVGGTGGTVGGLVGGVSAGGIVQNSYALGVVSSSLGSLLGGIAGNKTPPLGATSYYTTVQRTVALSPSVGLSQSSGANFGRVTGSYDIIDSTLLANNRARADMVVRNAQVTSNDPNSMHGADVTRAEFETQAFWQNIMGWDFSNTGSWMMGSNNLPILRGIPADRQSPFLKPIPAMAYLNLHEAEYMLYYHRTENNIPENDAPSWFPMTDFNFNNPDTEETVTPPDSDELEDREAEAEEPSLNLDEDDSGYDYNYENINEEDDNYPDNESAEQPAKLPEEEPEYDQAEKDDDNNEDDEEDDGITKLILAVETDDGIIELIINIEIDGEGEVMILPDGEAYDEAAEKSDDETEKSFILGETITITAIPSEDWIFVGWQNEYGEIISDEPDFSFELYEDMTLIAVFIPHYNDEGDMFIEDGFELGERLIFNSTLPNRLHSVTG